MRRLSYQWKIFIPTVAGIWIILLMMALWQYNNERDYRTRFVSDQLDLITKRLTTAIHISDSTGNRETIHQFLDFVNRYYVDNPLFDRIRISIYDDQWNVCDTVGTPIILNPDEKQRVNDELIERQATQQSVIKDQDLGDKRFFYLGDSTPDNRYRVIAALPDDEMLEDYINGEATQFWCIILVIALCLTAITYYFTRAVGRNIRILGDFARRSATDPAFIPGQDYPHDELGDIARQIVQMYNERATAREHIEREHRTAMNAIEEKGRQKRQLTNNINHELKTPIGVIKGYLDTIIDNPDMSDETRRHFIAKARDHANRLVDLIADVSAITRLEEGMHQMATECIDFHELAYTFTNDLNDSGALGVFNIEFDVPTGIHVRGNNNLLVGVLMNLTKNALHYSQGTGCFIEYRGEDNDHYTFAFYDDGVGVPPEALPHLFDRFYRIDSGRARKSGGTGLGLAIVYNTITAHNGTIEACNRADGGLEFIFTLPKWRRNNL